MLAVPVARASTFLHARGGMVCMPWWISGLALPQGCMGRGEGCPATCRSCSPAQGT